MTDQHELSLVNTRMDAALRALSPDLDPAAVRDVRDYLDHAEYGVAW